MIKNKFEGWLIKTPFGILPNKFIFKDSYEQTPLQRMDLDPRRNAKGLLIRNVLPYAATTIKFQTIPMSLDQKLEFQQYFSSSDREKITLTYWCDETNDYRTADFYIPDITWSWYGLLGGVPYYNSCQIELIGYGEEV